MVNHTFWRYLKILPTRLYWVLFSMEDLRQVVETAKRILTKEKRDRQLAGQSSSTPFMSMKDSYASKGVTLDTQDGLEEKTDRFTSMMSKLTAQDGGQNKQFNPKYSRAREEDNEEIFIVSAIIIKDTTRTGKDETVEIEEFHRPRYEQNYRNDFKRGSFRGNIRMNQNFKGQNYRDRYRENYRNDRGRSRSRERQYQGNIRRNDRSRSSRLRSGSRASTNRDKIRCYKCREFDHFTKDCPMSKLEKESDKIQQMFNMEEKQIALKTLATDTYDSLD